MTNFEEETDYYALLNISKKATPDEIRSSYKRFAVTYHPDRHQQLLSLHPEKPSSELLQEATEKFTLIKTAYETLINPQQRALYDLYGVKGLQSNWQLTPFSKSHEEMKKQFGKLHLKKHTDSSLFPPNSMSTTKVAFTFEDFVNFLYRRKRFPLIPDTSLSYYIRTPLWKNNIFTFGGGVTHHRDHTPGISTFVVGWEKNFSSNLNAFAEISASGPDSVLHVGAWRKLSKQCAARVGACWQEAIAVPTNVEVSLERQWYNNLTGIVAWNSATYRNLSVQLKGIRGKTTVLTEIRTEPEDISASLSLVRTLSKRTNVKATGRVSINGRYELLLEGNRAMNKYNQLGLAVSMRPEGVLFSVSVTRGGCQRISFPIAMADHCSLKMFLATLLVPLTLCLVVKIFWIEPKKRIKRRRKLEKLRQETAKITATAKKNAESSVQLMLNSVARKRLFEEQRKGLIIVSALYGNLESEDKGDCSAQVIDVSIPLQQLVEDSQLHLHEGSKSGLLGFYDPCIGEEKQLYIRYLFRDKLHEVTNDDCQPLRIPLVSHRIEDKAT